MTSLSHKMMEAANETSKAFKAKQNYEAANDANLVDSLINSIHHGYYDHEWLPKFITIANNHPFRNTEGFSTAYSKALEVAKEHTKKINP